jgi:hypothetical protein
MVEYIDYYKIECDQSSLGTIAPAEFQRRWRAEVQPKDRRATRAKPRVTHRRPAPFDASERTGRPWMMLIALRGVD